jgi:parallel beta-helix repeat protein
MALEGRALLSTTWTVTSLADDGSPGTLRYEIGLANATAGVNYINFAVTGTITLNHGQLELSNTNGTEIITGPGANRLSVSANGAGRVFESLPDSTVSLSGLTITGGYAPNVGGGLLNFGGTVSLSNVRIEGNSAEYGGGLFNSAGTLSLTDCTVSGNFAGDVGGGIANGVNYNGIHTGTLSLSNCTVSYNRARHEGGGVFNAGSGGTTLTNCTVSGNTAGSGGGLSNDSGQLQLSNATVTGNTASGDGGGLSNYSGDVQLTYATVTGNTASAEGGGLFNTGGGLQLTNTIVSGNSSDIKGSFSGGTSDNLIGGNALLGPLGNYGGPTLTVPLLPGSPAIGGGTATGAPPTDQRGVSRPKGTAPDIGAFQSQGFTLTPVAGSTPQSAAGSKPFANPLAVTVTANNSVEPVDGGVITFTVPPATGASATLSAATATIAGGQASVTATANSSLGMYTTSASASGAGSASFALTNTEAAGLRVTTARDVVNDVRGLTSLRAAIAYANSHPGPDTIIFDPAFFGTKRRTIRLVGGPLVLNDPATTTIVGPGANRLTISAGRKSRVFDIEGGSLALEGLTITDGRAERGGGILNDRGTLALDHVVLRGNRARLGGGLYNNGTTTLTDVVLRGNTAGAGSGLFSTRSATLTRRRLSSPASTGQILSHNFNGTGGVPKHWIQILGPSGAVIEKRNNVTITDSTESTAGIA